MPKAVDSGVPETGPQRWKRRLPTGIAGAVFWLALWFGLLWLLRQSPSVTNPLLGWMQIFVGIALIGLAVPLAWRLIRKHLLWSLRNKLILTYILIGLAPVVLFLTLVLISAYIAAGQFSVHLADNRIRQQLDEIGVDDSARASRIARALRDSAQHPGEQPPQGRHGPRGGEPPQDMQPSIATTATAAKAATEAVTQTTALGESLPDPLLARLHRHTSVYLNGAPLSALIGGPPGPPPQAETTSESSSAQSSEPLGLPVWAIDLHGNQFRGLVLDGQDLYLVAIDQRHVASTQVLSVITSLPVDSALMDVVAQGLGRVGATSASTERSSSVPNGGRRSLGNDLRRTSVFGGAEPQAVKLLRPSRAICLHHGRNRLG